MTNLTTTQQECLELAQCLHFFTSEQMVLIRTLARVRHPRTEKDLRALVKKQKLATVRRGKWLIYAEPYRVTYPLDHMDHGLACSQILVMLRLAEPNVKILSEKKCHQMKWGITPEAAVKFPSGVVLLEYCSLDNVQRGKVKAKVNRYNEVLGTISQSLGKSFVLFVLDVPRNEVIERAKDTGPNYFFVDYKTFQETSMGKHLVAPIYIWGGDGKTYPLRHA